MSAPRTETTINYVNGEEERTFTVWRICDSCGEKTDEKEIHRLCDGSQVCQLCYEDSRLHLEA